MKINYNVSAAIANKHLLGIEGNLKTSMERLSSGLKINSSKDNPAGMAISNKMRAQIKGLDQASSNASDGISVIEISDGALNEVTSILQRMRELSVQAASNATMSQQDKEAIQDEFDSLKDEVNRISRDTEYNTKTLLDGSLDTRIYADHATRIQASAQLEAGIYGITITAAATQAGGITASADFNDMTAQVGVSGSMSINGFSVSIEETDTYAEAYEKIRDAAAVGETTAVRDETTGEISFTATAYGKNSVLEIAFSDQALAGALGVGGLVHDVDNDRWVVGTQNATTGVITVPMGTDIEYNNLEGFTGSATVSTEGNRVTISDIGGVRLSFLAESAYAGDFEFEVTEMGTMTLHIGANMDQNMEVRIPEVSTESLYIDQLNVTTVTGADRAIASLDKAIAQVSDVRSSLGAYQNRLEYTTKSLDAFEENMTGAISRLTDVDMADEMTNYTHQNVLNQAAISVLTQANELPQQVLQILQ